MTCRAVPAVTHTQWLDDEELIVRELMPLLL
jgi:hypothetical protein